MVLLPKARDLDLSSRCQLRPLQTAIMVGVLDINGISIKQILQVVIGGKRGWEPPRNAESVSYLRVVVISMNLRQ